MGRENGEWMEFYSIPLRFVGDSIFRLTYYSESRDMEKTHAL
jgi:hypothetical protein